MYEVEIHDYLKKKGLPEYGIAGLMGNLFAESGLNPRNLQNSYENTLGMNDNPCFLVQNVHWARPNPALSRTKFV